MCIRDRISTIDILSEQAERILENNAYFGDPFMGIQKEMPYQREAPVSYTHL